MKSLLVSVVAITSVTVGCDDAEISKPICDPVEARAGRVALEHRVEPERLAHGQAVMYENGAYYLFVDSQCSYWVTNPNQVWGETRSGMLDTEASARLGKTLHFGAWPDLSGTWSDPRGGIFDAPVLVFDDVEGTVVCVELCDAPEVPAAVKAMRKAFPVVAQELWESGGPTASNIRAIAVLAELSPQVPFVDWPLARPISDFVRAGDIIGFGEGTLESDVASVAALKELRASFVRGDHGEFFWNRLPVKSDGKYFHLYLRDTLPFEDANGLVPLTVELGSSF